MAEETPFKAHEGKETEGPLIKTYVLERFISKFIDILIMGAFFAFPTAVGPLAGTTYILISDGLQGGSIGKRIIGLKAVSLDDPTMQCDFKQSIIRNSVFALLIVIYYILGWIPYMGKVLVFLSWVAVLGMEMVLIYTDDLGERFGDRIAGTIVIKGKKASDTAS